MQRYPIMSRRLQSAVEITAYGYAGRTRQCWIEEWPDGWVVQEGTDSSFAIVTDKLPSRVHAIDAVFDFIAQEGGNAVIEDEVRP